MFEEALALAGNRDVTIRVLPDADHVLRVAEPAGHAHGYVDLMRDRMLARVG